MPSRYEGYGMAFAGALASGLPVVAARAGAVPGTVPPDAGILVPPEDAPAVREALYALLTDRELRRRLSDAAWAHAQTLPRWTDTARIIAAVLGEVAT
jgi:glycosyltransferase involved in cell wall biosynthesis